MRVDLPCCSLTEAKEVNVSEDWWHQISEDQLEPESLLLGDKEGSGHQRKQWNSTNDRINAPMHKTWLVNVVSNLAAVKQFLLDYASYDRAKISHGVDDFAVSLLSWGQGTLG